MGLTRFRDQMVEPTSALSRRITSVVWLDDPQFNAAMDGSDDSVALAAFLTYCANNGKKGYIPRRPLGIGAGVSVLLTGSLDIDCEADITNIAGAAQTSIMIEINGAAKAHSVRWRGGRFNGAATAKSIMRVYDVNRADLRVDEQKGIVCKEGVSNSVTSAILVQNFNSLVLHPGENHSHSKGDSTQGSIPRCVSFNDGPSADVVGGLFQNAHCGIVGNSVTARINGTTMVNLADNGLYAGAGTFDLMNVVMDGAEEPIVASDFGQGGGVVRMKGGAVRNSRNAFGLQGGSIILDNVEIDYTSIDAGKVVRTRPSTPVIVSPKFEMRNCDLKARVNTGIFYFDGTNNTLASLVLRKNRIEYIFDTDAGWSIARFLNWLSGTRFEIDDNTIVLSKIGAAAMPSGDRSWNLPTVTALSVWRKNTMLNLTAEPAALIRTNTLRQTLVKCDGIHGQSNVGAKEYNMDGGSLNRREIWAQGVPTSGNYLKGDGVPILEPNAGGTAELNCTTGGIAGSTAVFKVKSTLAA